MTPVNPDSQAVTARQVLLADEQQDCTQRNKMLVSKYTNDCIQWQWNRDTQGGKAGVIIPPIPAPPPSWVLIPHMYTAAEKAYDAAWPGIPALMDESQTGAPVAPQYQDTATNPNPMPPAPGKFDIGPFLRTETRLIGGQAYEVRLYESMPDDTEPAGTMLPAPDGTIVHKVEKSTPFGVAQWYEGVAS